MQLNIIPIFLNTVGMGLFRKPLAGPGYVVLNLLRIMNIIALVAVMVASWVMLVKTFIISKVSKYHVPLARLRLLDRPLTS